MENPKPRSYFPTQFDPRHAPLTRSRIPHPSSAPKGEGPGSINLSSGQPSTDEKTTDHHHSSHNTPPTTYSERGDRYGKKSVGAPQELDPRKSDNIITSVPGVPVTKSRKPFIPKTDDERKPDEGYEESSSEVGYERGLNRDHTEMGGTEGVRLKNAGE